MDVLRFPWSFFNERRILGGTAILALTQVAASVAGLVRDRLLNQTFPREVTDTFFAAFRPSDFLFQTCILSALGTVLVPLLAGHRAHGRQTEMDRLLSATLHAGAVAFGAIALLLAIVFPWVAPWLVQFEGDQLALYIQLGRLALLSNFLFVFGTTLGQYLITVQRFWIYGLTPILYTCGTILGTVYLTRFFGELGPMLGTLLGAAVYALLRYIAAFRAGARLPLGVFWDPHFPSMGVLMLPRVLSLGALQVQLLVFDAIGSGLGAGAITVNAAARNFQSVAVGAVGIALAQAVYSPLSQAYARGDQQRFRRTLLLAIGATLLLTIPSAVALALLAPVAAALVHLTASLPLFSVCLAVYALSIPLDSMNHVLLRARYARRDTLGPALWTVANGVVSMATAFLLSSRIGPAAIAAGFLAGQAVQAAGLGVAALLIAYRPVAEHSRS